jgi:hypothetical protein
MAGAKTRFGFAGNGSEPPDSDEARAARTVIGREVHLPEPPDLRPTSSPSPPEARPVARAVAAPIPRAPAAAPRAAVPVSQPEEDTEELPSRRPSRLGRSRLARFLGRWTESGNFVSDDRVSGGEDDLDVPRDSLGRNVLLVLAVAVVAFSLTFLVVKLRQHFARASTPTSVPAQASAPPAPAPSAATPTR